MDLGLDLGPPALTAKLANRFVKHLRVELESNGRDLPRLLLAEQVSRAADLEIVHRQAKAAAQVVERGKHLEPLLSVAADQRLAGKQQIRVCTLMGATDATAHLTYGEMTIVKAVQDA